MLELLTHICWGSQTWRPRSPRRNVRLLRLCMSTYLWRPIDQHLFGSLLLSYRCLYRSQKLTDTYAEPSTIIKSENENVWWLWIDDLQSCFTKVTATTTSLCLEKNLCFCGSQWLLKRHIYSRMDSGSRCGCVYAILGFWICKHTHEHSHLDFACCTLS